MIEQLFQALLPNIEHFHSLTYWAAFVAAFAETALVVGLLVPGSTLLLLLGALSATGQIDFAGILWFGVAGAVLGDNLNYWLGKRFGQRWLSAGVWFLKPGHFEQAHTFFDHKGARSVFLGRFIPSIKEIVPFIAGSAGMRRGTFLFWNLLGGIGWGLEWIGGGLPVRPVAGAGPGLDLTTWLAVPCIPIALVDVVVPEAHPGPPGTADLAVA